MEKSCKTCIHYPCLRIDCGKVCNQYKTEVQEILEGIDLKLDDMEEEFWEEQKRLKREEAITKLLEEGYQDWERRKVGGNMREIKFRRKKFRWLVYRKFN